MALGILNVLLTLLIYKFYKLTSRYLLAEELTFNDIVIPFLGGYLVVYALNYFVLQSVCKYLETENLFKEERQPKSYSTILLSVIFFIVVILII